MIRPNFDPFVDVNVRRIERRLNYGEHLYVPDSAYLSHDVDGNLRTEYAYGYETLPIENSTHLAGDSVVLDVEPGCGVEPVLITSDIELRVAALRGEGALIMYNVDDGGEVSVIEMDQHSGPVVLKQGDAYAYLNRSETEPLTIVDDCTPAFKVGDELQLTVAPPAFGESDVRNDELPRPDGRKVPLPVEFWQAFVRE